jgi:hypothetical protein
VPFCPCRELQGGETSALHAVLNSARGEMLYAQPKRACWSDHGPSHTLGTSHNSDHAPIAPDEPSSPPPKPPSPPPPRAHLNLSPICGVRTLRMRTLTKRFPRSFTVSSTRSTSPCSCARMAVLASFLAIRFTLPSAPEVAMGEVFPIRISLPETREPGKTSPSSSSLS